MNEREIKALNGFLEQVITLLERIDANTTKVAKKPVKKKDDGKTLFRDHVRLTMDQYKKLTEKFGETLANRKIDELNNYGHQFKKNFAKYDSHYHAILSWSRKNQVNDGPDDGLTDYERALRDET